MLLFESLLERQSFMNSNEVILLLIKVEKTIKNDFYYVVIVPDLILPVPNPFITIKKKKTLLNYFY